MFNFTFRFLNAIIKVKYEKYEKYEKNEKKINCILN
jgi:hypothetical protein